MAQVFAEAAPMICCQHIALEDGLLTVEKKHKYGLLLGDPQFKRISPRIPSGMIGHLMCAVLLALAAGPEGDISHARSASQHEQPTSAAAHALMIM